MIFSPMDQNVLNQRDMYRMGYKCFDLTHCFDRCGCPKSMKVTVPTRVATNTVFKLVFGAQPITGFFAF